MPTTSRVSHGRDASSGPVAISYRRSVSAPYASYISSGDDGVLQALAHLAPLARDGLALVGERAVALGRRRRRPRRRSPRSSRVRGGQDVALVEQPGVRLVRRQVAEVEQHLVPEAGVQQVQHGVLDAADVQVDAARVVGPDVGLRAHPVALDRRVDERVLVRRVEVAQLVPARAGPLRHHVGVAPVRLRAVAEVERRPRPSRSAGRAGSPGRRTRRRGRTCAARSCRCRAARRGSIVVGQRVRVAVDVVDDRERLAPVALAAEQPVAQLVGDRRLADARWPRARRWSRRCPRRPCRCRSGRASSFAELTYGASPMNASGHRRRVERRLDAVLGEPLVGRLLDGGDRRGRTAWRTRSRAGRRTARP